MSRWLILMSVLVVVGVACQAVDKNGPALQPVDPGPPKVDPTNPYPGGSPFPPGGEPTLTHVVKAFWTTSGGIVTRIDVTAKGSRPTQTDLVQTVKEPGGRTTTGAMIAPDCNYHLRFAAAEQPRIEGVVDTIADGSGTYTVRVHGFKKKDFADLPVVEVRYFKDGKLIGETTLEAKPIPANFKER